MTEPRTNLPAAAAPAEAPPPDEKPAPTFDLLPLSPEVRQTLADMGYLSPTPVQLAVWEPATRGRDAVVQARTGTGKTAAFGLPIIDHLVKRSIPQAQVLVLCPTRELALQVSAEIERLSARRGVRIVAIYGGAPMPRQVEAIAAGAQVIVGTPGRVLDHLRRRTLDPKAIRLVVLDEADEMLSMGFERELTAILEQLPPERQTLLFSATVPPDIERIARTKLKTPEFLTLSGDHIGALEIGHFVYMVAREKMKVLVRVIEVENPESAIIFCNTRDETEKVAQALVRQGYDADWLNGDLPQTERERVMSATREGRLRFLVATDVAARGIDVSHLTHVINHDFPQDAEGYVHRTGRTGRAGRTGQAISLVTPRDIGALYILRLTYKIRPIEKQIPSEGEIKTRAEADLVTMFAEAFAPKGTHPEDLALARRLLSHDQYEAIVAGLLREHLGARPTSQEEASAARRAPRPSRDRGAGRGPSRDAAVVRSPARELEAARAPSAAVETPALPEPRGEPRPVRDPIAAPARPAGADPRERRPARLRRDGGPPIRDELRAQPESARHPRPDPRAGGPVRHSDFANWTPPEEEGDDQPILGEGAPRGRAPAARPRDDAGAPTSRSGADAARRPEPPPRPGLGARGQEVAVRGDEPRRPRAARQGEGPAPDRIGPDATSAGEPADARRAALADDGDFVEIFVNVGRRDGARAGDLAKLLSDAGIDKDDVRRIRVRERNSFVSVRRGELTRAVGSLSGASIAGKVASAEQARERAEGARGDEAPAELDALRSSPIEETPKG